MSPELKAAWDEVLFWAKRLSYKQADNHPEWKEHYEAAKKKRDEIRKNESRMRFEASFYQD